MHPLLHIENLALDFSSEGQTSQALRDFSLTVTRNEIVALVGESGSGKSVTALSILRLLDKTAYYRSGKILFSRNGQDVTDFLRMDEKELRKIRGKQVAMIFQEPMTSLNPVLRCGEQVTETIRKHTKKPMAAARREALNWFEKVQLPNPEQVFRKYPFELSGGQKQRVMIAMAMCCHPALLICDEPTTALDVSVQKTILELIRDLQQQEKMGVIFITHDLGVVSEIADRVAVMHNGTLVEEGERQKILDRPEQAYTRGLLACRQGLYRKGHRLPVVADFLERTATPAEKESPSLGGAEINEKAQTPLLTVEELSVWFPAGRSFFGQPVSFNRAVEDVSFEIFRGETLGLVGESGCGKTTLGRALLRLLPPTRGRILYEGSDIALKRKSEIRDLREKVQIIFQDPYSSLNPRLPIGPSIAEPLKVHRIESSARRRKELVVDLLEKVGMPAHHYNRYPHEFSGGQRQRIGIARALSLNPSFLVCDESVSALDVSVQAQVLNLLQELKKEFGFTILFISHDLLVVRYISDRILVMNQGKIEETGPADEVFLSPRSAYTQKLIDSIPGKQQPV